jgi:CzcA family heavy metal efflux pump
MKFAEWVPLHRRSILFLLFTLGIAGLAGGLSLPVGLFPQTTFPRVVVSLDAGDRPADRMTIEVTFPVEQAVRAVPGVVGIRSTSSRGSAEISVNFNWGQDMVGALLQVESAVGNTLRSLPAGTNFDVRRMDPTIFPVLGYSLVSDTRSLVELKDIGLYQITPTLSTVSGVARVQVQGGATAEYQVLVDPARLNSFGLTLDDVAASLSAANIITAVGRLEADNKLYLVLSDTQFADFNQVADTILRSGANGLVRLGDVATVSPGVTPQWIRITADGHDAVLVLVYQQPGGNTVSIASQTKAKFAALQKQLPPDVRVANWYDQSELVVSSAGSVRDAIGIGVIFAGLVLFLFLRNVKVMLITAITVPMVLASTALLLTVLHMSFNIMTLGGMAAAVGLIVDDMVVMIEHIMRRLRGGSGNYKGRVMAAAAEFTRPLAASSASTIIIFAPLAFLSGVTGAFFKALSLTIAASLILSFIFAWVAVPILASYFLKQKDTDQKEGGALTEKTHHAYGRMMRRLLARPWLVLIAILPLLAAGYFAYQRTGSGFMPVMDEGGFILDYVALPGLSLTETDRLLRQVESILQATPEVQTYSRRTGAGLGGTLSEANHGDFFVRLKPLPRRPIDEVMNDVQQRIEQSVPGLTVEMAQLMEDLIGDLTAVPQPIEIKLFSDDHTQLLQVAPKVADALGKITGVVSVKSGIVLAGDALDIRVDREKAALEGVAPDSVTKMLDAYLSGVVTTQIQQGQKMVGIRVWIPPGARAMVQDIEKLQLRAPDGHLFPLKRVATTRIITGQPEIMREDFKQMVAVTGRISGRDLGSTALDAMAMLNRSGFLPGGVTYALGGLYQQQQIAFRGLMIVFASAVVLVFTLLLFLYESFLVAVAMLLTTLLAMAAVFIGLWLTHTELNITAMMGMTMIIGIVTEVAIFYYSEYHEIDHTTAPVERFILAGQNRMRPIAMTTLAAILALMPLALGIGQGAAMEQPLAIAIISGLTVQLPLVLIALPLLIRLLGGRAAASRH